MYERLIKCTLPLVVSGAVLLMGVCVFFVCVELICITKEIGSSVMNRGVTVRFRPPNELNRAPPVGPQLRVNYPTGTLRRDGMHPLQKMEIS